MPQTLLALFGLALSSLLVLNQQHITTNSRQRMVSDEIELAASGLASDIMEMIGARSFDEKATPEAILQRQRIPTSSNDFTTAANLGDRDRGAGGCNLLRPSLTPECDDIDDVSGQGWQPVSVELAHGRTIDFEVQAEVFYVTDPGSIVPSTVRTRHKRVTLSLRSPHLRTAAANGHLVTTRVISYDPIKAELDFERLHGALGVADPPASGGWVPNEPDDEADTTYP